MRPRSSLQKQGVAAVLAAVCVGFIMAYWHLGCGYDEDTAVTAAALLEENAASDWASAVERASKFKDVNELRHQLSRAREELYELKKKKAEERRIAERAGIELAGLDDSGPAPLRVTMAAAYCNCPALDNGSTARQAAARNASGVWQYERCKERRGKVGFVRLTDAVAAACPPEDRTCSFTWPEDRLPNMCGKPAVRLSIDFRCANHPERSVSVDLHDKNANMTLVLDCTKRSPVPKVGKNVDGIRPVVYPNVELWPISFTVPVQNMEGAIPWKNRDFAETIPGNLKTYKQIRLWELGDSQPDLDYFNDYRRSYYCITRKKRGWDCLRHYEILAQGCVPYFLDIDRLPANIMPFYPRELIKEAMQIPGVVFENKKRGDMFYPESYRIDHSIFNKTRYFELAAKIQSHARRHLRSDAMARYVLDALEAEGMAANPKKVLFLHHCYADFMGDSLWSGFKELELIGELDLVHDHITGPEYATDGVDGVWGKAAVGENCGKHGRKLSLMANNETLDKFWYYHHVNGWANHRSHNYFPDDTAVAAEDIPKNIEARLYDAIIYANPSRTMGYMKTVQEHYKRHEVAMVFGDDMMHAGEISRHRKQGVIFARELHGDADGKNMGSYCMAYGLAEAEDFECCHMEEHWPTDNGLVWSTVKGDGKRWKKMVKEGESFECSTVARYGHKISDKWSYHELNGEKTTVSCQHERFGGVFKGPDAFPGYAKSCQCLVPPGAGDDGGA